CWGAGTDGTTPDPSGTRLDRRGDVSGGEQRYRESVTFRSTHDRERAAARGCQHGRRCAALCRVERGDGNAGGMIGRENVGGLRDVGRAQTAPYTGCLTVGSCMGGDRETLSGTGTERRERHKPSGNTVSNAGSAVHGL